MIVRPELSLMLRLREVIFVMLRRSLDNMDMAVEVMLG